MDLSNVQTALILLSSGDDSELKQSQPYATLVNSSVKVVETNVANLPTDGAFDVILAAEQNFSSQQFEQIFKQLKPNFYLYILKLNKIKNLPFLLKVAGFVVAQDSDSVIVARKPDYAVGSAVKIDLNGTKSSKKVWSLATDDLEDNDLIDDEDLLDEQDKVKPSAEELRVCASTKQRKACANCSCGLAEELEQEEIVKVQQNSQNAKSSCGNCYLGDAFRCGGCPYRGMPAFKPGEKIVIDNTNDI